MRAKYESVFLVHLFTLMLLTLLGCSEDGGAVVTGSSDTSQEGLGSDTDRGSATDDSGGTGDSVNTGVGSDTEGGRGDTDVDGPGEPDRNGDGVLNILVLGTSKSIEDGVGAFSADQIAMELQNILSGDAALTVDVNVAAEDIHMSKQVTTGLGQGGDEYEWTYYSHSLAQYYYWPEDRDARMGNLAGKGEFRWDQVVIGADPYIVQTMPGYYALGVNKVAAKVAEGGAQPLLLMLWPQDESSGASIEHFAEFTYRVADGARVRLPAIPAGRAWEALPDAKRDSGASRPTPNGAYLTAATIYSHLYERAASSSEYKYDDELADVAWTTVKDEASKAHYAGRRTFVSPFKSCNISDRVLNYNHTGTSSERGILKGLQWVCAKAQVELQSGGEPPIDFNYGRANTDFEADKRYKIDPTRFDFSLGFPMQDHSNHGDTSMLYGLDKRRNDQENGTDLGVARKMIRDLELPYARAIPVRTLFAQMREAIFSLSAYSDDWHMHGDLNRAIGAYMYTLLTGHCALDAEPADKNSSEWRSWLAHKTGYETAWSLMHMWGIAPGFKVMPDSPQSTSVSTTSGAGLSISFANQPSHSVTVRLSTDKEDAVTYEPTELVFTANNHAVAQRVNISGQPGDLPEEVFTITATTESNDPAFDGLVDSWEYTVYR